MCSSPPVAPVDGGFLLTTESAWLRAAIDAGAEVLGIEPAGCPCSTPGPPIPADRVRVVGRSSAPPTEVRWGEPAGHPPRRRRPVVSLPHGTPGAVRPRARGTAVIDAIACPVQIDTGMLSDAVVDLDRRGLLLGRAYAPYSGGTGVLYDWAPGRRVVDRVEHTHDPSASPVSRR